MTEETNAGTEVSGEDTAAVLNAASGQKDYLPEREAPEAQKDDDTPGEDATAAQPEPDAEAEHQPKPKKTAKDRIDELTWQKRELERQNQALMDRLGGQQPPAQVAHPQPQGDGKPDPAMYEAGIYDPNYIEDLTEWKAEEAVSRRETQRSNRDKVQSVKQAFDTRTKALFPDGEPDGLIAFRAIDMLPAAVLEVVAESEIGPKLAEYLGDNIEELARLSRLSPIQQARELTHVEARLAPAAKPSPKTVTAAPEPPPTARGAGGRFQVAADTADFSAFEKQYLKSGG